MFYLRLRSSSITVLLRAPPVRAGALRGGGRRSLVPPLPHVRLLATTPAQGGNGDEPSPEPEAADLRVLRALRMHPEQCVASEGFNRSVLLPACIANHASLGAIFAWSVLNQPLMRVNGVVAPSAADWALSDIQVTFSLVMGGFMWGAVFGGFHERWGPRACCLIGAGAVGGGFGLVSTAVATNNLPMLKLGGLVWGLSMGWAYVPPLANVIRWYPERKGFASSAVVVGYGMGAFIATPVMYNLLRQFQRAPTYLGADGDVDLVNREGRMFVEALPEGVLAAAEPGAGAEVVVATAADIKAAGFDVASVAEGVYLVGSGSTGAVETFALMGLGYMATIAGAAYVHRLPPPEMEALPAAPEPKKEPASDPRSTVPAGPGKLERTPTITAFDVSPYDSVRTPQFALMYVGFGLSITGTYGIISSGSLMLTECFQRSLPEIVTPAFTAGFVSLMSVGNLGGRLFWANASDYVAKKKGGDPLWGRKATFATMWGIGPPLYLSSIYAINANAQDPSALYLGVFTVGVVGIMSGFGGTVAMRPPICADLFGVKSVGLMSAYQLSVVMPASFFGPQVVAYFRQWSTSEAIADLSSQVSPEEFEGAFGASHEELSSLVEAKTVTINRLMVRGHATRQPALPDFFVGLLVCAFVGQELVPADTPDPTPFVYDKTLYSMAGLCTCAWVTNALLKPVDPKLHIKR